MGEAARSANREALKLAAGMPDNHVMITGEEGEPIRVQFEAALAQAYGPVVEVAAEVVEVGLKTKDIRPKTIDRGTSPNAENRSAAAMPMADRNPKEDRNPNSEFQNGSLGTASPTTNQQPLTGSL